MGAEQGKNIDRRSFLKGPLKYLKDVSSPIANTDFYNPTDLPDVSLGRRKFIDVSGKEIGSQISSVGFEGWDLMQDIINGLADKIFSRRKLIIGSFILTLAANSIWKILSENPSLFQDAKIGAKFLPVWQEIQELQTPYTDEQLMELLHNPFKKISLTAEEAADLLFVGDADSMYLKNGERENSKGILQPDCWLQFLKDKINIGLDRIGIKGNAKYANYAQPGAASPDMVGPQRFDKNLYGNVQLGALTRNDMVPDNPTNPQTPPRQLMEEHNGTLIAAYGLHGNDLHKTADLIMSLLDEKRPTYDAELVGFIKDPKREKLEKSDHLQDVIVKILQSYKNDKEQINEYVPKALAIYEQINKNRLGKGKMYLVVTQPFRFDEAENAPYVPSNAPRGTKGEVNLKKYGKGGKVAGLLVTLPFYKIEAAHLKAFEERTGVQVSSLPMLPLSGQPELVDITGHLKKIGHEKFSKLAADELIEISHVQSRRVLNFQEGLPIIKPLAA